MEASAATEGKLNLQEAWLKVRYTAGRSVPSVMEIQMPRSSFTVYLEVFSPAGIPFCAVSGHVTGAVVSFAGNCGSTSPTGPTRRMGIKVRKDSLLESKSGAASSGTHLSADMLSGVGGGSYVGVGDQADFNTGGRLHAAGNAGGNNFIEGAQVQDLKSGSQMRDLKSGNTEQ